MASRSPERPAATLADDAHTGSDSGPGKPLRTREPAARRPRFAAVSSQEDAPAGSGAIALSFAVVYRKRGPG